MDPARCETVGRRATLLLLGLGLALRAGFLLGCDTVTYQGDPSRYIYLAVEWMRFGHYSDAEHFLWPPGYSFLIARCLDTFGLAGIEVLKWAQVALSAVVGASVIWLACRFFGRRAALLAGAIWATYLPLAAYPSLLRPETLLLALLLPALCLACSMAGRRPSAGDAVRAAGLGMLLGAALYLKEAALPYALAMTLGLALHRARGAWAGRLSSAAVTLVALVTVVLPWSLRNQEVYGHLGSTGVTLGHNLSLSVNETYKTLDYRLMDFTEVYDEDDFVYRTLIAAPPGSQWSRSAAPNVFDRSRENRDRAWQYFREHPGYVLRGRVKRLADSLTPLSFVVRMVREDWDEGLWTRPGVAPVVSAVAIAQTALLLLLGLVGVCSRWVGGRGRWIAVCFLLATASTVPLVAMSRFRLPAEPVLIVAAAGLLTGQARPWTRVGTACAALLALAVLGTCWWINSREILHVWRELAR